MRAVQEPWVRECEAKCTCNQEDVMITVRSVCESRGIIAFNSFPNS